MVYVLSYFKLKYIINIKWISKYNFNPHITYHQYENILEIFGNTKWINNVKLY